MTKKYLNLQKTKKRTRLRSLIAYNTREAAGFHDLRYYMAQQDEVKNQGYKLQLKTKLSAAHKKIVTDMIYYYKEHAKNYMNKAWLILDGIYRRNMVAASTGQPPPIHSDLMGVVSSLPVLLIAYKMVRKNKGAMTLAYTLSNERKRNLTILQVKYLNKVFKLPDGISIDTLRETSTFLKSGTYPWGASRRIWIDKSGSKEKGTRPITIPPFIDRVVQSAIKIVLEAIYEPWFEKTNRSFGFRSNKGCHDAISTLTAPHTKIARFAIEGDFKKAYDSVNKATLINILSKRIHDRKFLNMMEARLKYQFFDTKTEDYVNEEEVGIPQGGSDSPYLFNIYLAEFDNFVLDYTQSLSDKLNRKVKFWDTCKEARPLRKKIETRLSWLKKSKIGHNKLMTTEDRYSVVKEIRLIRHRVRKLPSLDYAHQKIKFIYVRYADDWIILSNAPVLLLEKVKAVVTNWALKKLHMTLIQEKTLITDVTRHSAHFLGFEIKGSRYRKIQRITAAVGRTEKRPKDILKKVAGQLIHAYPDKQRLISRLCMKGYCDTKGFPRELPFLTHFDTHTIISRYNSVISGLFNYYVGFIRYNSYMSRWYYILKYSCLKTLAQKFKISIRAVLRKFRVNTKYGPTIGCKVRISVKDETYSKSWRLLTYLEATNNAQQVNRVNAVKDAFWCNEQGRTLARYPSKGGSIPNVKTDDFLDKINWVNVRTQAGLELPCAICGCMAPIEMHHIKHIRKEKLTNIHTPWQQAMYLRNRKQIPLCIKCHRMVHKTESLYGSGELGLLAPVKKLYDNHIVNIEAYIKPGKFYAGKTLEQKGWTKTNQP